MNNNTLMVAVAGSGKTTYLVNKALELQGKSVLISTYTEINEAQIREKIFEKVGYIPSNITIQTWFSFLLQHGVRPYQSVLNESLHNGDIGFYLTSEKSGKRYNDQGKPIVYQGKTLYWGEEKDFKKFYFTKGLKIYSDKISKFVFSCNKKSNNQVMDRIARIFDYIFIDEIQDLAGYDLELIKLFFKSRTAVLLVGDPRQVTYLTHHSLKFGKYSNGQIKSFVEHELGKRIQCLIDETALNASHRNNQPICDYSAKLYPSLPIPSACTCEGCRDNPTVHEGVFLVKPNDIEKYLSIYNPVQLRWNSATKCNPNFQAMNFGESKGLSFNRVLIARKLLENTRGGLIAGVGVIILLWSVIKSLGNIEQSFNFIWGIQKSRSLSRKFSDYLSIALIALILVIMSSSVSVFITTQITMMAEKHTLLEVVSPAFLSSLKFIPYALVWILFSFMYIFIPNTKVRFFSGVFAGLIAGTIYQVGQGGYIYFQVKISNYNAIYGSFAALPFFVLWLQMSWLVVLFGTEIAFYHQNLKAYQYDDHFSSLSLSIQKLLALRIAHLVIINFSQGKPPLSDQHIADTLTLPLPLVQQHVTELAASGIILNTPVNDDDNFAYQPAKAIDLLTVQFVLDALEHQGRNTAQFIQGKEFSVFADILKQFDQTVAQSSANRLLKDISTDPQSSINLSPKAMMSKSAGRQK